MPQGGVSGWSVDSFDEEARELQQRIASLTASGRMSQSEALRQIAVEDNQQLVKMKMEKAQQEREREMPAQRQERAEPEQQRTLIFSEDREPQAPNYNLLKQEQAELTPVQEQPGQGRKLIFSEDREAHALDYNALKRENAEVTPSQDKGEGRTLTFAEDKGQSLDRGR